MAKNVGRTHGRPDLERCGLFWEMSYMNGRYVKPLTSARIRSDIKAFPVGYPKWKGGLQDCYFDKKPLKRIFIGESFWDGLREYYREVRASNKTNVSKTPFISLFPLKEASTPGDHWGTFEEKNFEAFSPLKLPETKEESKRGIFTQFPKKGGYGRTGFTFDKFPDHKPDSYDAGPAIYSKNFKEHQGKCSGQALRLSGVSAPYFDPNPYLVKKVQPPYLKQSKTKTSIKSTWLWGGPTKKLAGDKSGCFEKYPLHSADKYLTEIQVRKELNKRQKKYDSHHDSGKLNISLESKKWIIKSTADYNVKFKVHAKNWKCARPFVVN